MVRDTLFIAGNGLTIDLIKHLEGDGLISKSEINSSSPFSEDPKNPDDGTERLIDVFFELKETIKYAKINNKDDDDFKLRLKIMKIKNDGRFYRKLNKKLAEYIGEGDWLENGKRLPERTKEKITERAKIVFNDMNSNINHLMRLFLVHSFVDIDEKISRIGIENWRWVGWFGKNYNKILFFVSFNYDLILEKLFRPPVDYFYINSEISFLESSDLRRPVPIFKPHGSINFEFSSKSVIVSGDRMYNKRALFPHNDGIVSIIDQKNLNKVRISSDIVLPSERSSIVNHGYNSKGFHEIAKISLMIKKCVIVGLSFWDVDRPEIFQILGSLESSVNITIISPHVNPEIDEILRSKFQSVKWEFNALPDLYA